MRKEHQNGKCNQGSDAQLQKLFNKFIFVEASSLASEAVKIKQTTLKKGRKERRKSFRQR